MIADISKDKLTEYSAGKCDGRNILAGGGVAV